MRQKEKHVVIIDGREYTIVGQYSRAHIEAVTEVVNQQLSQLHALDPHLSTQDRALLMAINAISDQMIKEQTILDLEQQVEQQLKLDLSEDDSQPSRGKIPFDRS